ncbi:MAG: hypothetical protein AAF267_17840 [Deinococcota bacterium]
MKPQNLPEMHQAILQHIDIGQLSKDAWTALKDTCETSVIAYGDDRLQNAILTAAKTLLLLCLDAIQQQSDEDFEKFPALFWVDGHVQRATNLLSKLTYEQWWRQHQAQKS